MRGLSGFGESPISRSQPRQEAFRLTKRLDQHKEQMTWFSRCYLKLDVKILRFLETFSEIFACGALAVSAQEALLQLLVTGVN